MTKKIAIVLVSLLLTLSIALAQWTQKKTYSYKAVLKVANLWGPHGVAVDPEGKIWVCPYEATDTLSLGSSSLLARRQIFVFNPNGTQASFSPIRIILGDSLNNNNTSRGINTDSDGNILFSSFNRIFKINYKTGVGIAKVEMSAAFGGNSVTAAASDSAGNIFVTRVSNANQSVRIFDKNLIYLGNAVDSIKTGTLSRTLAVSGDGKTLYLAQFGSSRVFVYYSDFGPGFGAYTLIDTIMTGMTVESINWQPRPGKKPILWGSAGNRNNPPADSIARVKYGRVFAKHAWYGFDVTTKTFVDSLKWGATFAANPTYDDTITIGNGDPRARGITFTKSGDTAYVAMYMLDSNSVKMFTKSPNSVSRNEGIVAQNFSLGQNYPNPFNPSTKINFSILGSSKISLKVYDVLGKEVATLANGEFATGSYTVDFNATNISAGIYFYTLTTSNGFSQTKKMLLLK